MPQNRSDDLGSQPDALSTRPSNSHLSIRQHTAVHPPTLMMAIMQMGTSTLPLIALHEADLSILSTQYRAIALAHAVIRAIYNGDIAKPTFFMAETAELKDELDTMFFNIGSWLSVSMASRDENVHVERRRGDLMGLERYLGMSNFGYALVRWRWWNRS
jgi:hypothetical protein